MTPNFMLLYSFNVVLTAVMLNLKFVLNVNASFDFVCDDVFALAPTTPPQS